MQPQVPQHVKQLCRLGMSIVQQPAARGLEARFFLEICDVHPATVPRIVKFFSAFGAVKDARSRTMRVKARGRSKQRKERSEVRIEFQQLQQELYKDPHSSFRVSNVEARATSARELEVVAVADMA